MKIEPKFLPESDLIKKCKNLTDSNLINSLNYLINLGYGMMSTSENKTANSILSSVKSTNCFSHIYHSLVLDSLELNKSDQLQKLLFEIKKIPSHNSRLRFIDFGNSKIDSKFWQLLKQLLQIEYETEYGKKPKVKTPEKLKSEALIQEFSNALEKIKLISNRDFNEIQTLIDHVVFIDSDYIAEGSSFRSLGCIYVGIPNKISNNWLTYADILIHETAHNYLYNLLSFDPIILNDRSELFNSPFRADKRPLSGIFHAFFVIARLIVFLRKAEDTKIVDNVFQQYYSESYHGKSKEELLNQFKECNEILKGKAKFSEFGAEIFKDLNKSIHVYT